MYIGELIISFFIAVILTGIFAGILKAAGPWKGYWPYFLILFFVALAAARWINPIGPTIGGYYWIPGLVTALIVALLILAATPATNDNKKNNFYNPDPSVPPKSAHQRDKYVKSIVVGASFWFLIALLIITIVIGSIV